MRTAALLTLMISLVVSCQQRAAKRTPNRTPKHTPKRASHDSSSRRAPNARIHPGLPRVASGTILARSSLEKLSLAHVANLHPVLLGLARAEIAARHGHAFQEAVVKGYLSKQRWYRPLRTPTPYSAVEKHNLKLLRKYEKKWRAAGGQQADPCDFAQKEAVTDLDGDGKTERVKYVRPVLGVKGSRYDPCANNKAGFCGAPDRCFTIIDLDVRDKQREVMLVDFRGGMQQNVRLLTLRKGRLKMIFHGEGARVTTDGLGRITLEESPGALLMYSRVDRSYVLTPAGDLKIVPRAFYRLHKTGRKTTMKRTLSLVASPKNPKVVLTVKKGEAVTIEGCDEKRFCRISNAKGKKGWFEVVNATTVKALKLEDREVFAEP